MSHGYKPFLFQVLVKEFASSNARKLKHFADELLHHGAIVPLHQKLTDQGKQTCRHLNCGDQSYAFCAIPDFVCDFPGGAALFIRQERTASRNSGWTQERSPLFSSASGASRLVRHSHLLANCRDQLVVPARYGLDNIAIRLSR
jgi:hypothetical protein